MDWKTISDNVIRSVRYCLPCLCRDAAIVAEVVADVGLVAAGAATAIAATNSAITGATLPAIIIADRELERIDEEIRPQVPTPPLLRRMDAIVEDTRDVAMVAADVALDRAGLSGYKSSAESAIIVSADEAKIIARRTVSFVEREGEQFSSYIAKLQTTNPIQHAT